MNKALEVTALVLAALAVGGCAQQKLAASPSVGMANPASAYCVETGGRLRIEKTPQGAEGICVLPNGMEMEEWTLFRKDHPAK